MNHLLEHPHLPLYVSAVGVAIAVLGVLALLGVALYQAWLWSRFANACGGHRSAMTVLKAAEATLPAATDAIAERGMKSAKRRGWL